MEITGYKYTTEQDAINSQIQVNAYYNIPVTPGDVTQNWVNYETADLDSPKFWYIKFDNSLKIVLGDPSIFEVAILNNL